MKIGPNEFKFLWNMVNTIRGSDTHLEMSYKIQKYFAGRVYMERTKFTDRLKRRAGSIDLWFWLLYIATPDDFIEAAFEVWEELHGKDVKWLVTIPKELARKETPPVIACLCTERCLWLGTGDCPREQ